MDQKTRDNGLALKHGLDAVAELQALKAKGDFRWLIEAPGTRYLAVQRLSMSNNFEWTADHNKAIAFRSEEQADALMMAIRQIDRDLDKGRLFAFEATLGNAKAIEHGWIDAPADKVT